MSRHDAVNRAGDLLRSLQLLPGPDTPVAELSKGNRQKLALAQAFLCPVELLVLDEPYNGLDRHGIDALEALVDSARRAGSTVIKTVHEVAAAEGATDVYLLDHGILNPIGYGSSEVSSSRRVGSAVVIRLLGPSAADHQWLGPHASPSPSDTHEVCVVIDRRMVDDLLRQALERYYSILEVRSVEARCGH